MSRARSRAPPRNQPGPRGELVARRPRGRARPVSAARDVVRGPARDRGGRGRRRLRARKRRRAHRPRACRGGFRGRRARPGALPPSRFTPRAQARRSAPIGNPAPRRRASRLACATPFADLIAEMSRLTSPISRLLSDRDAVLEVDVLDRVQQRDAFFHRSLERLASADQAGTAGALVDHRGADRLSQVVSPLEAHRC